jgi:hypothetical protein
VSSQVMLLLVSGKGDYVSAMTWLDRADSIPLGSEDVRDGIKVCTLLLLFISPRANLQFKILFNNNTGLHIIRTHRKTKDG